jgi:hypothetical protein
VTRTTGFAAYAASRRKNRPFSLPGRRGWNSQGFIHSSLNRLTKFPNCLKPPRKILAGGLLDNGIDVF